MAISRNSLTHFPGPITTSVFGCVVIGPVFSPRWSNLFYLPQAMLGLSTNKNCLPDVFIASPEVDRALAMGNNVYPLSFAVLVVSRVLAVAVVVSFFGVHTKTIQAGCHVGDPNWYNEYHHGFRTNWDQDLDRPKVEHAILIYENGELRSIPNPLPPPCNGPNCSSGPGRELACSTSWMTCCCNSAGSRPWSSRPKAFFLAPGSLP